MAYVAATGSYIPPKKISNDDLSQTLETSDEWIHQRTGIRTRFLVDSQQGVHGTVDMAHKAAHNALQAAGLDPSELDMIIVATVTADQRMPSAACLLQDRIKARNSCAFDISAACSGSLYALALANSCVAAGSHKCILVVGSETMSSLLDWKDRGTCVLFGDAAAAAIVQPSPQPGQGFQHIQLCSDGTQHHCLWAHYHGTLNMNGREVYKTAVPTLVNAAQQLLQKANVCTDQLAVVIPHQANLRIIEAIAQRLNVDMDRFVVNLDRYANTSSASLLLAWDEARRSGRICPGDWVLLLAIGAGLTWGVALYRA